VWPHETGTYKTTLLNHHFKVPLRSPLYVDLFDKTSIVVLSTVLPRLYFEFRAGPGLNNPRNKADGIFSGDWIPIAL
jgi:hypothetical protein